MLKNLLIISALSLFSASAFAVLGLSRIIPDELKDSDIALMKQNARENMNGKSEGTVLHWSNPESKNKGKVILDRKFTLKGSECRTVKHYVLLNKDADNFAYTSTICKDSSGQWHALP